MLPEEREPIGKRICAIPAAAGAAGAAGAGSALGAGAGAAGGGAALGGAGAAGLGGASAVMPAGMGAAATAPAVAAPAVATPAMMGSSIAASGAPAVATTAAPSIWSQLQTGLDIVGGLNNLVGPQGSLVKGDLAGAAKDVRGLSGNISKAGDSFAPKPSMNRDRSLDEFGIGMDTFNRMSPEMRQEVLRKLVGRG